MLVNFFHCLRQFGVPVTPREHVDLLAALESGAVFADQEAFYHLARTVLVKDEKHFDRFDLAMQAFWSGVDSPDALAEALIPGHWLRKEFMRRLSAEQKARIEALGGLDQLMEKLRERLAEQKDRHAGGDKWIGTGGTSPFGHGGYHPTGIRIGGPGGQGRAVKVWEKRQFRNLDGSAGLGARNVKVALRRLRRFAREGAAEQLDLDGTIRSTAKNAGLLDIRMRPERRNAVKVLMFLDVGGSMDRHVRTCEELFSAARSEFKRLRFYYFHNFIYESVWRDNRRRFSERTALHEVMNKYGRDHKVIFVGDASMAAWEITWPGGGIEHHNEEAGQVWMERVLNHYDKVAWLNPTPRTHWDHTESIGIVRGIMEDRMYPLTVHGLERAMGELAK